MKLKIVIVDYGLGNIRSAQKSLQKVLIDNKIEGDVIRSSDYKSLLEATHIILPGQGAFKSCIDGLNNLNGMVEELNNQVCVKKKPILGICVGMQLFANESLENGNHLGLGWIKGKIIKLPNNKNILPHMGWNEVVCKKNHPTLQNISNDHFYFVHSYYFDVVEKNLVVATANYGIDFPAAIAKDNIFGVQFHPEKSSESGSELISNFLIH